MTAEEQDTIIGKTVRERGELRVTLMVTDKELETLRTYFKKLDEEIRDRIAYHAKLEPIAVPAAISKYADLSRLVELVNERIKTYKEIEFADELLRRMGVP